MKKKYIPLEINIDFFIGEVIIMSGDGYDSDVYDNEYKFDNGGDN